MSYDPNNRDHSRPVIRARWFTAIPIKSGGWAIYRNEADGIKPAAHFDGWGLDPYTYVQPFCRSVRHTGFAAGLGFFPTLTAAAEAGILRESLSRGQVASRHR